MVIQNDMAVIDGIIMRGRCIILPELLKIQTLEQLHINHMGKEKTKLLACESTYWVNINDDIKNFIKKMHYMSYVSVDTTEGQDDTSWHPAKTMGHNWYICVHSQ